MLGKFYLQQISIIRDIQYKYTCNDCLQLIMDNMMNTKWCADKYVFVNFYNIKYTFDDRIQQMMQARISIFTTGNNDRLVLMTHLFNVSDIKYTFSSDHVELILSWLLQHIYCLNVYVEEYFFECLQCRMVHYFNFYSQLEMFRSSLGFLLGYRVKTLLCQRVTNSQ